MTAPPCTQRLNAEAAKEYTVFRSYSEPGGIKDEMVEFAAKHRNLVKLEVIGHTVQGQEIIALKVTKDAKPRQTAHARRCSTPPLSMRVSGSRQR